MTTTVRSFMSKIHHLPWVCAAIILVAGLLNWTMFSRKPEAPPIPDPPKPAMFLDENAFRQAVMPKDGDLSPFGEMQPAGQAPFGFEEAQSPFPGEPNGR